MRGSRRALWTAAVLLMALALAGCESLYLPDWFNNKKPLPGERKAVFPEGVPGVPQGVPSELVRGYQPPPEPEPKAVEAPPEKPKPKPKRVAAPALRPGSVGIQPVTQPAGRPPAQQQASPWPTPPARSQTQSPFPDPPPAGTFSR